MAVSCMLTRCRGSIQAGALVVLALGLWAQLRSLSPSESFPLPEKMNNPNWSGLRIREMMWRCRGQSIARCTLPAEQRLTWALRQDRPDRSPATMEIARQYLQRETGPLA